jgi:hypothetical protein
VPSTDRILRLQGLFGRGEWQEIVRTYESFGPAPADADLDYLYARALAQLGLLEEAREGFLMGRRMRPRDARFPIELAGIAFRQKRYSEAEKWLRRGLRIDPADAYANDFLATIYFLEGNLEAALSCWNRIGKPQIDEVRAEPVPRVRADLLDRALTFSPAAELRLSDLRTSEVRTEALGIFSLYRPQLAANEDGRFDAVQYLQERNGWGSNAWDGLLSTFSGVAYQTLYPSYYNLGRSAVNITSLVRWDDQKRRLAIDLAGPFKLNPKWRYRMNMDLRNENWAVRDSFTGPAQLLGALNLRREVGGIEISSFNSGRWDWTAGAEISYRDYRDVVPGSTLTPQLLLHGMQLKQLVRLRHEVLLIPEHRLVITSRFASELGRIWSQPAEAFAKLQGSLASSWLPKAQGDDFATQVRVRSGVTIGQTPFDELYMLGLERDNDLWLRAHIGTHDGRKGSAPLGTRYLLTNAEIDKNVYSNGLFTGKLSPFLDTGKITDPGGDLGSPKWLWDTGIQAKLRVLGVSFTFSYGKDLRTGNNAYYFMAGHETRPSN